MSYCSSCGCKIEGDDLYCPDCGAKINQTLGQNQNTEKVESAFEHVKSIQIKLTFLK